MITTNEYLEERLKDPKFANEYNKKLAEAKFITNPQIYFMIGNIGSGKSTWVKQNKKPEDVVISLDNLRYCFNNGEYRFNSLLEPDIFSTALWSLRLFLNNPLHPNIYLDNTNVNVKMRECFLDIVRDSMYNAVAIVMPQLTREEAVTRRMKNSHGNTSKEIWESIWDRFNTIYELPTIEEGFKEVILL